MAGWVKPPPVIILSGTEWFLRRREIRKAIHAARSTGRTVERVHGEDTSAVAEIIEGGMFGGDTLVLVEKPEKIDADLIDVLLEDGDGTVCLVLHHEGAIRKGSNLSKIADKVKKAHHILFNKPPQKYKLNDYAVKFAVLEAKSLGVELSTDLADALVGKVGTDLGVLHFELLKVEAYMASGEPSLTVAPAHLMATMMRTGEANFAPLVNALGRADSRRVLQESTRLTMNFSGEESSQTLVVCAWIGGAATRWLHASALHDLGASEEEAASRMGMHVYTYKSLNLPIAKRWGKKALINLLKKVSSVEMFVRKGHISPWVELECALLSSCRSVSFGG